MFFTVFVFFENNALGRRPLRCVVELLPHDIALAFVGRFRCSLQRFLRKKSPFFSLWNSFQNCRQVALRLVPEWPKKVENMRKLVQSLCALLRLFRSEVKENFYHNFLPHVLQMCTRIKYVASSLQGATKNCQVRTSGTKSAWQGQRLCAPKVY